MATIDYGSVVKKNGQIIQTEMFMDMKDAVGFEIDSIPYRHFNTFEQKYIDYDIEIKDEFFSYVGDSELLLCIYKCSIYFVVNNQIVKIQRDLRLDYDLPYELQKLEFNLNGVDFRIKRLADDRNRYKLRFIYNGDLYEVLYGYGVDVNKNSWYGVSNKERRYIDNWFR